MRSNEIEGENRFVLYLSSKVIQCLLQTDIFVMRASSTVSHESFMRKYSTKWAIWSSGSLEWAGFLFYGNEGWSTATSTEEDGTAEKATWGPEFQIFQQVNTFNYIDS